MENLPAAEGRDRRYNFEEKILMGGAPIRGEIIEVHNKGPLETKNWGRGNRGMENE